MLSQFFFSNRDFNNRVSGFNGCLSIVISLKYCLVYSVKQNKLIKLGGTHSFINY